MTFKKAVNVPEMLNMYIEQLRTNFFIQYVQVRNTVFSKKKRKNRKLTLA